MMKKQSFVNRIKSFSFGAMAGIFFSLIYWSYSVYFEASLPLSNSILGCLFFAISWGLIATTISVEGLMSFLEHLP